METTLTPTPTTQESHSGIPPSLIPLAEESKLLLHSTSTPLGRTSAAREEPLPVLPPDVDRPTFNAAIQELREGLGEEWVVLNTEELDDGWYMEHPNTHDAHHVFPPWDLVSSGVCYPSSTADVQLIVRWANKYLIPIHPISLGRNFGYGGAAPRVRGSLIIDLGKRMNRVLKLDGENCSALLEPGVTYFSLWETIRASGLDLWVDVPDLGGGSVLGNACDRGVGYTPYGDHWANHCGLEVVLPTGEIVRTGMGALPGKEGEDNPTWQSFQYGYGPFLDGIFSQSNYGIVTTMGVWLMPATQHTSYMLTFAEEESYPEIMSLIRPLAINKVLGNVPQLRHAIQELTITGLSRASIWDQPGSVPPEVVRKEVAKLPCGECSWVFYGTVYGPAAFRAQQLKTIKRQFFQLPGTRLFLPSDVPSTHYLHSRALVCSGQPVLRELNWLAWVPNGAHVAFSPICPTGGEHVKKLYEMCKRRCKEFGLDFFPTLCVASREAHVIVELVYDKSSPSSKHAAYTCIRTLIADAARAGYGEYRTHLVFSDQVAGTYNWNGGALMKLNERLKDALDPRGVLSPGRNGIWPRRFRDKGWEMGEGDGRECSTQGVGMKFYT
ncbi:vanillyl-alcohol oxidase [Dacryopinax primogenitus]|uniref:Vanillyl-alcohol oxidase n=1 Tax=Dacryopinax primogenitus (strain DJM 731) TaxID=1858805 RepID=M5FTW7_DACPD|nr:vanillyl-alcohol oxidase [Dacryopinax primogenitus]EJT98909.1 vanillyl-alcohol oxidase [Dacryopinax primogenitus]